MSIKSKAEYAAYAMARNVTVASNLKIVAGMWVSFIVLEIKATTKFRDRTSNLRQSIGTDAVIGESNTKIPIAPTDVNALTEIKIGVINILIPIAMEYAKDVEDRVHYAEPVIMASGPKYMIQLWDDFGVAMGRFQDQYS